MCRSSYTEELFFDLSVRTFVSKVLKLILFLSSSKVLEPIYFRVVITHSQRQSQSTNRERKVLALGSSGT